MVLSETLSVVEHLDPVSPLDLLELEMSVELVELCPDGEPPDSLIATETLATVVVVLDEIRQVVLMVCSLKLFHLLCLNDFARGVFQPILFD